MEKIFKDDVKSTGIKIEKQKDDMEIDLFELLFYFRSKIALIIAAFMIGAVVAGAVTYFFIEPLYQATSKIYVVSASSDTMVNLSDLNLGTSLSLDYEEVIKIRPIFNKVIEDLELDYTYEELLDMVDISTVKDTRILTITVTDDDPIEAQEIANAIADQAETQVPKLMDTPKPHVIEPAIVPLYKSSPSFSKNIMIGALGAVALVLAILTVIFVLEDTVNSADDIERMFGTLPLAVIPEGNIGTLADTAGSQQKGKLWLSGKKKGVI